MAGNIAGKSATKAYAYKFHRQNPLKLETPNLLERSVFLWRSMKHPSNRATSGSTEVLRTIFCSQTSVWRAVEFAKTSLVLRPPNAWESIALRV
jgi:hypothetical protein